MIGPVPLLPIQRAWLDLDPPEPHHHNQALLLEATRPLDPDHLRRALAALLVHHDMLRVRLGRVDSVWAQTIAPPNESPPEALLDLLDLAEVPNADRDAAIEAEATRIQRSLDLARGPVIRALLVRAGASAPERLLLAAHHLAVDGVSWRVLLGDLWTAYEAIAAGAPIALPPKTTSYRAWAERLLEHVRSGARDGEAGYWLSPLRSRARPLPAVPGDDLEKDAISALFELDESATESLLREVPEAYHTQISDVLLAALAPALARFTGSTVVLVDLEGHGREEIFPDLDVSRTVGWFTTLFPAVLSIDADIDASPGAHLTSIKEQLRSIPERGLGYGLLRYLRGDASIEPALRAMPAAEVVWNYLGQLDQALPASAPLRWAEGPIGPSKSPLQRRGHALDLNAHVIGGRLRLRIAYGARRFSRAMIEELGASFLASLRRLIEHCRSPGAAGYSPSDFTKVKLDQQELDDVLDDLDDLDDLDEQELG
ncbi:MAG: condensation domain-containing protein [Byssovorax sp.]